jgi:hypothetical protein
MTNRASSGMDEPKQPLINLIQLGPYRSERCGGPIYVRRDMLVETLSQDWGAYREADGKVVWALIGPSGDP